jgi:DNA-binding transcriptional LysR family regulator
MRDVNLKAMEYFESVARLGRVSKAALELGVSPSAVSQQIRQIEAQFGVKLFRREKQRLVLTPSTPRRARDRRPWSSTALVAATIRAFFSVRTSPGSGAG